MMIWLTLYYVRFVFLRSCVYFFFCFFSFYDEDDDDHCDDDHPLQ